MLGAEGKDAVQTKGINPLALVCRDMAETVKFYTEALGMPLVKTVMLPDGGQHF
ncbi:VOC family protein, partial [Phenylobacterium sp.]|uniref:VOC family protein n=1 Tax=Phenylobacterium sp. TaxID=1871053 RepID=UPI0039C96434